jgi:hypothetical protein
MGSKSYASLGQGSEPWSKNQHFGRYGIDHIYGVGTARRQPRPGSRVIGITILSGARCRR